MLLFQINGVKMEGFVFVCMHIYIHVEAASRHVCGGKRANVNSHTFIGKLFEPVSLLRREEIVLSIYV